MSIHLSQSPRLMQIDPFLIKFHPANPRTHQGMELFRLKTSMEKVGMVQFPAVRDLYGEFVECLDGEGRVFVAQQNREPRIWVVNMGKVQDTDALLMLQAANAVRAFSLLDECRGLANLHRRGETIRSLADKFSIEEGKTRKMIDIGYFPDDLHTIIRDDSAQSEEHAQRWTYSLLVELLPLRQILPGKDPFNFWQHEHTLDTVYDYREVQQALEQVRDGHVAATVHDVRDYVRQRQLDIFQTRFDQTLHEQVKAELERVKQVLDQQHIQELERVKHALDQQRSQELERAKHETAKEYQERLQRLQANYNELYKNHQATIRALAKQAEVAEKAEQVEQLQATLQRQLQEVEQQRQELEAFQRRVEAQIRAKVEAEARAKEQQRQEEMQRQREEEAMRERARSHEAYAEMRAELEAQYARKERDLQLGTETTIHQIVADCAKLLTETQLSVLNLISPDVYKGVAWLPRPEIMMLVGQLRTVRETLAQAEEQLLHGTVVFESERRSYDGSHPYR